MNPENGLPCSPEREYTRAVDYFQALLRTIGGSDDPDKRDLILAIMAARKELDRTYTGIFNRQALAKEYVIVQLEKLYVPENSR